MATELRMPQLAMSMTEGELTGWLVEDGVIVAEGQAVYVVEGEKASQEVEAPSGGRLRLLKPAGAVYDVGTVLGEIV